MADDLPTTPEGRDALHLAHLVIAAEPDVTRLVAAAAVIAAYGLARIKDPEKRGEATGKLAAKIMEMTETLRAAGEQEGFPDAEV